MKKMTSLMGLTLIATLGASAVSAESIRQGSMVFEPVTREMAIERAMERFDAADKDGNGVLSEREMRSAAKAAHEKSKDRREKWQAIKDKPTNDRGAEMFKRIDTNGDGEISPEEMRAAREARAGQK